MLSAAEVVEDLGLGTAADGVAVVVGELGVLDDGAVLVPAAGDADVHDYSISAYYAPVNTELSTACAYTFWPPDWSQLPENGVKWGSGRPGKAAVSPHLWNAGST